MHDVDVAVGPGGPEISRDVSRGGSVDPTGRFRGLFACSLIAALAIGPAMLRPPPVSAAVAGQDPSATGQPSDDRGEEARRLPRDPGAESARTGSQSQPEDEVPAETSESRFPADRIITAGILQALLLAAVARAIVWRRSARGRGHPVERDSARIQRGDRSKSRSGARRSSSGQFAGRLEPIHARRVTPPRRASIAAAPERNSSSYVCLSLTDGRTIEGSLRGKEANGLVMVIDVDYVIEPDGTRRRGNVEDAFVPVSTVDRQRRIEGPRSA